MKNKIIDIWQRLSDGSPYGFVKTLYASDISQFIYCTLLNPDGFYGLGVSYSEDVIINLKSISKLRDVQVYITKDTSYEGKNILVLQLLETRYIEIFAVLCENLVQSIANLTDSSEAIHTIINHLEKWKTLFSNINSEGLSIQEQQGLYGEVYFLRKLLNYFNDNSEVLNSWIGIDKELRDFQNVDCAIEVKTTHSSNHQRLTISSERQLDESLLKNLFLYHLSVEVSAQNGESLNQIIDSVRCLLDSDFVALNLFNAKLMTVGYFDEQKELYNNRSYKFRRENSYRVTDDFPRIKESELMDGVGDVQYTIITDMCAKYLIPEVVIFQILGLCKN